MTKPQGWVEERRETVYAINADGRLRGFGRTIVLCCPQKHRFRVNASAGVAKLAPTMRVICPKCAAAYAKLDPRAVS
jgi:hypothetical protein